jgi:hypothetical protein
MNRRRGYDAFCRADVARKPRRWSIWLGGLSPGYKGAYKRFWDGSSFFRHEHYSLGGISAATATAHFDPFAL